MKDIEKYDTYLHEAMAYGKKQFPDAPYAHHAAYANSVAHALTGCSGGFGGPSMREHLGSYLGSSAKPDLTFQEACDLLKECCFGPITKQHAKYLAMEKCFGDTEEDLALAKAIAIENGYFQMYS